MYTAFTEIAFGLPLQGKQGNETQFVAYKR